MHTTPLPGHLDLIQRDSLSIRKQSPLVHNITNFVVMNLSANALLAVGASPLMAHAQEELSDLSSITNALVLNIGTLNSLWVDSILMAATLASQKQLPIVLDPVGAGASNFRTNMALKILDHCKISAIRANASEIMALANNEGRSKGVDSVDTSDAALSSAIFLSKKYQCTVVISGRIDYCVFGDSIQSVKHGSSIMTSITGMGCTATALIGSFLAVNTNSQQACFHAMSMTGICGEIAASRCNGPGHFVAEYLDALFHFNDLCLDNAS